MNAGKYTRKILIYQIEEKNDQAGFKVEDEIILIGTFYASVKTTKGFTLIKNDSDFEKSYTNFTVRYPKININRDMFILYNNKNYTIEYLNNVDEKNIELEIQAKVIIK